MYIRCPLSLFQMSAYTKVSPPRWPSPPTHLLRTVPFTHNARRARLWSKCHTATAASQALHFSPSPRTVCVECFVTKRMVPVLSSDCSQTHTCDRVTFDLNINLPTENFHSYWYSWLCLTLIENFILWRNNGIKHFLNMCACFFWLFRFITVAFFAVSSDQVWILYSSRPRDRDELPCAWNKYK